MKMPPTAIDKLLTVKAQILAEPDLYNQRIYAGDEDPCGTACCLAGWVVWNNDPAEFTLLAKLSHVIKIPDRAEDILGIKQSGGLFGTGAAWPHPFGERIYYAKTKEEHARVAADLIDYLAAGGDL